MDSLFLLIPVSLILGGIGLTAFFWALRRGQFDDSEGNAHRILKHDFDDQPKP